MAYLGFSEGGGRDGWVMEEGAGQYLALYRKWFQIELQLGNRTKLSSGTTCNPCRFSSRYYLN